MLRMIPRQWKGFPASTTVRFTSNGRGLLALMGLLAACTLPPMTPLAVPRMFQLTMALLLPQRLLPLMLRLVLKLCLPHRLWKRVGRSAVWHQLDRPGSALCPFPPLSDTSQRRRCRTRNGLFRWLACCGRTPLCIMTPAALESSGSVFQCTLFNFLYSLDLPLFGVFLFFRAICFEKKY